MKRHGLSLFVAALLMTGALYLSAPLQATDYEGPPPTTPDYGAEWTGPFLAHDPENMNCYDTDLIFASNGDLYSCTMGYYYDANERLCLGLSISRFDQYGNCLFMDRRYFDYSCSELYFYWYENPNGELWITGIADRHRFYALHVSEEGEADVSGFQIPLPDTYIYTKFLCPAFTDSLGYPNVLMQRRVGTSQDHYDIVKMYRFSHDFSEVLSEYEYPDIEVLNNQGGTAIHGPGDTLHVIYNHGVGENPWNTPLFYAKIGFEGEVFQEPVTHMDTTGNITVQVYREQAQLVVDNQNNVYIICQHLYGTDDRRAFLHMYRNDGSVFLRDLQTLTGYTTFGGQTLTLDCMGRVHLFWTMYDDDLRSIGHAAVTNGNASWAIDPHFLQVSEDWTVSVRYDAVCSSSEYRIFMVNSTSVPHDWDNVHMWQLGQPEEPDTSGSHSLLNTQHPVNTIISSPQAFPNPFNSSTTVRFYTSHSTPVLLSVFDILGREITVLTNSVYPQGWHSVPFHCRSGTLSSGTYFLHISIPGASPTITRLVYTK